MEYIYIITFVIFLITSLSSFSASSCKRYVANTYLYLLTSFLIIASLIKYYETTPSSSKFTDTYKNHPILFAITIIILFIAILYTPPSQLLLKHIMWFMFIVMFAILTYYLINSTDETIVKTAMLVTILLFAVITLFATLFKEKLRDATFSWVMFGLFAILAVASIFTQKGTFMSKTITLAIIGIVCYSLVIETKELLLKENGCIQPDYVDSSAGFFVSIQNIFARLIDLQRE